MTWNPKSIRARLLMCTLVVLGVEILGYSHGHAQPFAYVTNDVSPVLSVIDTATNTVVANIPVGMPSTGVAIMPDWSHIYVTHRFATFVSVIETSTKTAVTTIPVGREAWEVAITPNGIRAYVTNRGDDTVSVIDTATNTVVATVGVGNQPLGIAVTPSGDYAYIANFGSESLSVIDTATNSVVATVMAGSAPTYVVMAPDGSHAYVTNNFSATVSVIETATNTVVATIPVDDRARDLAITPSGNNLYVVSSGLSVPPTRILSVIETATDQVVTTIPFPDFPLGVAITPNGSRAYVAIENGTIGIIDTATKTLGATFISAGGIPWDVLIPSTVAVTIDIQPASTQNTVNLRSKGGLPVAILSTPVFDATQVAPATIQLAGAGVRSSRAGFHCEKVDVNDDGLPDLLCRINTADLDLEPGSTVAVLEAKTFDGTTIRGQDSIRIVAR